MATYGKVWTRAGARLGIMAGMLGIWLAGCNRPSSVAEESEDTAAATSSSTAHDKKPFLDPRLHQSFAQATRAEPPADWQPPDTTMTGQSVGKLYTEVTKQWDNIRFVSPEGKPLE